MILIASKELGAQIPPVMADKFDDTDEDVAERVILLRETVKPDMNCRQFAEFLGVSYTRLHNVERGSPLGRDLARRMVRKIVGLDRDWLYDGTTNGLHLDLAQRLAETASEKAKTGARGLGGGATSLSSKKAITRPRA